MTQLSTTLATGADLESKFFPRGVVKVFGGWAQDREAASQVIDDLLAPKLQSIIDPDLSRMGKNINILELGLPTRILLSDKGLLGTMTLTTPGCHSAAELFGLFAAKLIEVGHVLRDNDLTEGFKKVDAGGELDTLIRPIMQAFNDTSRPHTLALLSAEPWDASKATGEFREKISDYALQFFPELFLEDVDAAIDGVIRKFQSHVSEDTGSVADSKIEHAWKLLNR